MKKKINLLHISPDFNYTCGVSKYIVIVLSELQSYSDFNLFFLTNKGDSLTRLENIKVNVSLMNFEKGFKNIFFIKENLKQLKEFCIKNSIDIIHTHHRYPELLSNLIKNQIGVKTITTVHSLVKGFKLLSFRSDKIIAVSKAVADNIIHNYKVDSYRIIQIYNPVKISPDDNKNFDRCSFGISKYDKVFLFVGRWNKVKGVDIMIKVFKKLFSEYNFIKLILITDISDAERERISKFSKNFIFIKPLEEISCFYRISDYVILPSKLESFPFVMLESGIYNTLFIGSNVGGISEFIDDGSNGLLFNYGEKNLNEVIKKVLSLDEKTEKLISKNLSDKVANLMSPELYTKNLIEIYKSLL